MERLFKDTEFGHSPTQAVQQQIIQTVSVFLNLMAAYNHNFKGFFIQEQKANQDAFD